MTPTILAMILTVAAAAETAPAPPEPITIPADQATVITLPVEGKAAAQAGRAEARGMAAVRVSEPPPLVAERGPDGQLVIRHRPAAEPVEDEPEAPR